MPLCSGSSRGQAMQLGLVLVFGILVIIFSINQAVLVPSQNKKVAFQHSKQVQEDFVSVQSSIIETARGNPAASSTVDLGTQYPPRPLAVNSAPPSGSLYTTEPRPVVVENTTGGSNTDVTDSVCPGDATARALVYQPTYAQYDRAPHVVYENTLAANRYESGRALALTDQQLIEDGGVSLVLLAGNYSRAGIDTVSLDPVRGHVTGATVKNPQITLPTTLPSSVWQERLGDEVDSLAVSGGNVTFSLSGDHRISCTRVGIGSAGGNSQTPPAEGGIAFNPAGPNAVELTGVALGTNTSNVTLTLTNNDGDYNRTIERARLAFFTDDRSDDPTQAVVSDSTNTTLTITDSIEPLATPIPVNANSTATVELRFDGPAESDVFVFTVVFANGERVRYRVQVPGASE